MSIMIFSLLWASLPSSKPFSTGKVTAFVSGKDGYHTFRIPALLRHPENPSNLILFAEGRKLSSSDHGWNDIVMKKSLDGGTTWGSLQVVYSESTPNHLVTIGNPSPIALHTTPGKVILVACRNNADVIQLESLDFGVTWSNATDITAEAKNSSWNWIATGPPTGLQLESGRLLISADHYRNEVEWASHAMYSDDEGKSWKLSNDMVGLGGNECQAARCANGSLIMNQRTRASIRQFSWSHDDGATWSIPESDSFLSSKRYGGGGCEGSTVSLPNGGPLIFSTPYADNRYNMTIFKSSNSGASWEWVAQIDPGPSAYSSLAALDPSSVALVYEADDYGSLQYLKLQSL